MRQSSFFFKRRGAHADLPSFPTRRSSDLRLDDLHVSAARCDRVPVAHLDGRDVLVEIRESDGLAVEPRSEEHTSELQSHSDLVCRLPLEKKKSLSSHVASARTRREETSTS